MIGIDEAIIRKVAHHKVSSESQNSIISDSTFDYENDDEENLLKKILLKPFINNSHTSEFYHEVDLEYNVLFGLSRKIYSGEDFLDHSRNLARHLISVSKHANIKDGDLFVAQFEDLKLDNKFIEALGIYKFEEVDSFLETSTSGNVLKRSFKKGIGSRKPEKACLILFTEEPYTILIIDNKVSETDYWQSDFIQHRRKNDFVNKTHNTLNIAKDYITSQFHNDFEATKADQIDFLNRSVEYFKSHDIFDKHEFEQEVFENTNVIESFQRYSEVYSQENEIELSEKFEISTQAVKKQAKAFKKVLKLDKNFHIYIHGDRNLIEQGIDGTGRKFYKIFYENEF